MKKYLSLISLLLALSLLTGVLASCGNDYESDETISSFGTETQEPTETQTETETEAMTETETETETMPAGADPAEVYNIYLSPKNIEKAANKSGSFGAVELSANGTYVTLSTKKGAGESVFSVIERGKKESGRYLIVKYRSLQPTLTFEFFSSTEYTSPRGSQSVTCPYTNVLIPNGTWQIVVLDLSVISSFKDVDGKYAKCKRYRESATRCEPIRKISVFSFPSRSCQSVSE